MASGAKKTWALSDLNWKDRRTQIMIGSGLVILLFLWQGLSSDNDNEGTLRSANLERGTVRQSVSASGTLSALVTVEVGTQLSGQINELHADYNSTVKEGQLIARIDPATFETRVAQAEAEAAIAKANVIQAEATVAEAEANYAKADRALNRSEDLRTRGNISAAQLDSAIADAEMSKARLTSAKAQVVTAQAQVKQRDASLRSARVDLERTYIRSPVDGVVIGREVDIGQTVAASMQAPILFTIAKDLTDMQLEVSVDEADIGNVRDGLRARFTVDAYPEDLFEGYVDQIRKAPLVEQNVVTYTVIVSASNADQKLLPGMTANVEIIVEEQQDTLLIPNRALRFTPPPNKRDDAQLADVRSQLTDDMDRIIWLEENNGDLRPIKVRVGISDGFVTELVSGDLTDEDKVAITIDQQGERSFGPPGGGRGGPF